MLTFAGMLASMRRWLATTLLVALLLVAGQSVAGDAGAFALRIPDGWVDLSPGAPDANLERVTPDVRVAATAVRANAETLLYAAAPDSDTVMYATLRPVNVSEPVDDAALLRASNDLGWHDHFVIQERRVEVVDGLAWGRFSGRADNGKRFLTYLVPGRPRSMFLLFVAPPDRFDAFLPMFEQVARSTQGAELPLPPRTPPPLGLLALVGVAVVLWLLNRARANRKREALAKERSGIERPATEERDSESD